MNPTFLAIISYKVFPAQMGGQKCVEGFYRHLATKAKLFLAVSKDNETNQDLPFTILPFLYHHKKGYANLLHLPRLVKLIRKEKIDKIIIEHSYLGWLGILLSFFTGKPFIIRSHNIETHRFRDMKKMGWQWYGYYEKWVHTKADHNFFITEDDRFFAIHHWKLEEVKCTLITCGTDLTSPPSISLKKETRNKLIADLQLSIETRLFLFNGSFDFVTNTDALRVIIKEILPLLRNQRINFKIIICGRWLDKGWEKVLTEHEEIIYKGFVEQIEPYLLGVDCFIDPVTLGSGIKVKMIDALSNNLTVISTGFAAKGVETTIAGEKMIIVNDYDWQSFADVMCRTDLPIYVDTPTPFYQNFHWDTIVNKALLSLQDS